MYTKEEIPAIIPALIAKLKELPEGSWTNTARLVMEAGFDIDPRDHVLFDIHRALFEAAEANDIFLDMSCHEGKLEGLLYNLDYEIRHLNAKNKAIKRIIITSQSGYVPVDHAYHDKLTVTKDSIKYKYTPWMELDNNKAWQWSYSTEEPSFKEAFNELEKFISVILVKEDQWMVMDAGAVTLNVTFEDGTRTSKEVTGFFYGEEQLLETLRKIIQYGQKTCPVILREYEDEEEE